jgi:hypothetical protein
LTLYAPANTKLSDPFLSKRTAALNKPLKMDSFGFNGNLPVYIFDRIL